MFDLRMPLGRPLLLPRAVVLPGSTAACAAPAATANPAAPPVEGLLMQLPNNAADVLCSGCHSG